MPEQVLIRPEQTEEKTAGGVLLPNKKRLGIGRVLSSKLEGIKKGDMVVYDSGQGYLFDVQNEGKENRFQVIALYENEIRGMIRES